MYNVLKLKQIKPKRYLISKRSLQNKEVDQVKFYAPKLFTAFLALFAVILRSEYFLMLCIKFYA